MLVINKKITNHNPESDGPVVRSKVSLLFGLREGVTFDLKSTNQEGKREMRAIEKESFTPGRRQCRTIAADREQVETEQNTEGLKNANLRGGRD